MEAPNRSYRTFQMEATKEVQNAFPWKPQSQLAFTNRSYERCKREDSKLKTKVISLSKRLFAIPGSEFAGIANADTTRQMVTRKFWFTTLNWTANLHRRRLPTFAQLLCIDAEISIGGSIGGFIGDFLIM